jgi:hypothetical protein
MPSAKHYMKAMTVNTTPKGLTSIALDAAVGFGASYGIGQVYSRFTDKWAGKNIAALSGVVGKLGAAALSVMNDGHATFASTMLNAAGQSGVDAYGLGLGLRHGRKSAGKKAILVPTGTDARSIPGGSDMTSLGALGRAPSGTGLDWDQVYALAKGQ